MSAPPLGVAIIGAGFAGIAAAIRLQQQGDTDFMVFERASALGGVWRANTYPGAACDVESHLYALAGAPPADWTRNYAGQSEILAYLHACAQHYRLAPHIRFGHTFHNARWDAASQHWQLSTSQGEYRACVLVLATGALAEPQIPALPGIKTFSGAVWHSASWNHTFDLKTKRVAVIGTGASAIQFVPAIQPTVARLQLYQRTAPWVIARGERQLGWAERRLLRRFGLFHRLRRASIGVRREIEGMGFWHPELMAQAQQAAHAHLAAAVPDPLLRAKLTPNYTIGCKRILLSDTYYPALTQPNIEVITTAIAEIQPTGIIDTTGTHRTCDAIIFGTGFHVTSFPTAALIHGRAGRTLAEIWRGAPQAHLGTTVVGFPNMFILQGPNTGLGHTSVLLMIEAQIAHLLGALRYMRRQQIAAIEPRAAAQAAFVAAVDSHMAGTVWATGGCRSWYQDAGGRVAALWPGSTGAFRRRVAPFDPREYRVAGVP